MLFLALLHQLCIVFIEHIFMDGVQVGEHTSAQSLVICSVELHVERVQVAQNFTNLANGVTLHGHGGRRCGDISVVNRD